MKNNEQLLKYDENIGLYDHINPILNLKDLNRGQVKELAKEIANNKSQTHSWQEISNDAVNYDSKNKRQEKRFKRIFNKQLNENLAPILEKQHKQELIDRMKSGDASAMSQWTTEGIDKFGHQFMPVMLTATTLPFGVGAFGQAVNTMGLLPALGAEAGSWGLGYGGYKLGSKLDDDFGTNWIAPVLSVASGIGGYGAGYKGMVKLGSRGWLPKGGSTMYGKQFITDVASDALNNSVSRTTPAIHYGTVKYYGPTMGKTTAAKTNPNLVDFDDYVRGDLEALASQSGMTRQQLMMSQDPTVRESARQLMLKSIKEWRQNPSSYGKTMVVSKSDILQDPIFDNQPLVLQRSEFLKRNAARGETDLQNSIDWYASTRRKGGNKLMEWPDPEGVYIFELEPFTPDPHRITFTPQSSKGSYAFFERPSKLTLAEKMGIPKEKKNNTKNLLSMQDMVSTKFTSVPGLKPVGGHLIANKVANHPHILDRTNRLQSVYKRFVDPEYVPSSNWRKFRDTTPGIKIVDDIDINVSKTNSPGGSARNIGGYYNPAEDVAYVRRASTPEIQAGTAFHETLHGHDFGRDKLNDWIIKHLIDPEKVKEMSPRAQNYFLSSKEAPVHALQQGFDKGLDIGAPYPGDAAFDELIFDSGIGGAPYYFKMQTPKDKRRLWRAMTGDLFVKKQGGKIENPDH